MFEFIGFVVMLIGCFMVFCGSLLMAYVCIGFGQKGTLAWCLLWTVLSVFGMYSVFNNSPYGVYNKSEQVLNDKNNTKPLALNEQEKVQR